MIENTTDFMQVYHEVYGDSAGLDDKKEYIQELNGFATKNGISELKEAMIRHGIENGYLDKPEMIYTVWFQVFNRDGSVNNEDIRAEFTTFEQAMKAASDGDVIRCSPHYNQYTKNLGFWEAIEKATGGTYDYSEYDSTGKIRQRCDT